jgi:EAL domain-containing protein (putative c-di-GMP-specific phosphodiesterase class I)
MLERIHLALTEPLIVNNDSLVITASSGITLYPNDTSDIDTLTAHAQHAMQLAKEAGRNRFRLYDPSTALITNNQHLHLQEVRHALADNQLTLYYQPKVNMHTGQLFGFEALIRWLHPVKGVIPPADFLPLIEDTDVEIQVGHWVVEHALSQLNQWLDDDLHVEVSVNISSHHLQWEGFYAQLESTLKQHPNINANSLQLEILESSVLSDITLISGTLKACRDSLGVRISLDDFGTGYSSLVHLRHLPVNVVKIDQTFVRDLIDDPDDYTIVDGVIALTQSFHREVIAEGVETTTHGLMLLLIGCDHAQGYGIARPMPAEDIQIWLNNYQPNQAWLDLAKQTLSPREKLLTLLAIESEQWLNRLVTNLNRDESDLIQWPTISTKKSLYRLWLEQASNEQLFDPAWLAKVEDSFKHLHQMGAELKEQFLSGKSTSAQAAIPALKHAYHAIEALLVKTD